MSEIYSIVFKMEIMYLFLVCTKTNKVSVFFFYDLLTWNMRNPVCVSAMV